MIDETVRGRREAEALREQRVANYAVKRAADWKCQHEACEAVQGVLVVESVGGLTTRCRKHSAGFTATAGQWIDR